MNPGNDDMGPGRYGAVGGASHPQRARYAFALFLGSDVKLDKK